MPPTIAGEMLIVSCLPLNVYEREPIVHSTSTPRKWMMTSLPYMAIAASGTIDCTGSRTSSCGAIDAVEGGANEIVVVAPG